MLCLCLKSGDRDSVTVSVLGKAVKIFRILMGI
jgi:hypothetical protein